MGFLAHSLTASGLAGRQWFATPPVVDFADPAPALLWAVRPSFLGLFKVVEMLQPATQSVSEERRTRLLAAPTETIDWHRADCSVEARQ